MSASLAIAYCALAVRILLLGCERIIVKKLGERSSAGATFLFFSTATIFLLPLLFFVEMPADLGFMKGVTAASAIYTAAFILYVAALAQGEVSLVGPLYNFNVFFLLILSVVFLGEKFTLAKLAGLSIIVYGASYLNRQAAFFRSLRVLFFDRPCRMMMACSLFLAIGRTIDGAFSRNVDTVVYAIAIYVVMSVMLFFYLLARGAFSETAALFREKPGLTFLAGFVNAFSYLFLLAAFRAIDVSVAEPASMLSMVVTVVLARFFFGEKIRDRLVGVTIMIAGAWLLCAF